MSHLLNVFRGKIDGKFLSQICLLIKAGEGKLSADNLNKLFEIGFNFSEFIMNLAGLSQLLSAVEKGAITREMLEVLLAKGLDFSRFKVNVSILFYLALAIAPGAMNVDQLNKIVADGIEEFLKPDSEYETALIKAFGEEMVKGIIIPKIKDRGRKSVIARFPKAREESQRHDNSNRRGGKKSMFTRSNRY